MARRVGNPIFAIEERLKTLQTERELIDTDIEYLRMEKLAILETIPKILNNYQDQKDQIHDSIREYHIYDHAIKEIESAYGHIIYNPKYLTPSRGGQGGLERVGSGYMAPPGNSTRNTGLMVNNQQQQGARGARNAPTFRSRNNSNTTPMGPPSPRGGGPQQPFSSRSQSSRRNDTYEDEKEDDGRMRRGQRDQRGGGQQQRGQTNKVTFGEQKSSPQQQQQQQGGGESDYEYVSEEGEDGEYSYEYEYED